MINAQSELFKSEQMLQGFQVGSSDTKGHWDRKNRRVCCVWKHASKFQELIEIPVVSRPSRNILAASSSPNAVGPRQADMVAPGAILQENHGSALGSVLLPSQIPRTRCGLVKVGCQFKMLDIDAIGIVETYHYTPLPVDPLRHTDSKRIIW
jgi:hypothetical protein